MIPTSRKVIALTFDAGANADAVPSILTIVRRQRVPAGSSVTSRPRRVPSWRRDTGWANTPR
ncbi:MAG TPA: hypothetical protein VFZ32_14255 [Micromonosporaceae bacterium]